MQNTTGGWFGAFFRYLKAILRGIPQNMMASMPDAMNFARFADVVAALPRKKFQHDRAARGIALKDNAFKRQQDIPAGFDRSVLCLKNLTRFLF